MFVVDDILMAPFRGIFWVCKEIHQAVQDEVVNEADALRMELSRLYMMLETGRISEEEFDNQEKMLLDRLDALEQSGSDEEISDDAGQILT